MAKRGKYGQGRVYQPTYKACDCKGECADPDHRKTVNKWYIQWYDNAGIQHRESTNAKTETEARKLLAVKLGQSIQGIGPVNGERSLRYGDIREDLLHDFRIRKLKSLETLSDGTETVKGLTKLDEFFGFTASDPGRKISTITKEEWEKEFIIGRRKEGVSDGTIANSAKLLRQMLNIAVDNKKLVAAPKITVPKAPPAREEFLTKEQFDRLLEYSDKKFNPVFKFLFYQGVRISETLGITWKQLDLKAGVYSPNEDENKTGNNEPKSLHAEVVIALKKIKPNGNYVFADVRSDGENLGKMIEGVFRNAMLELKYGKPTWTCSQCRATEDDRPAPKPEDKFAPRCPNSKCKNVPMIYKYVGPSPHCLRASCVVFYRESGKMSDREIMEITGHSSTKTFLGYSRTRQKSIKSKMDMANENRNQNQKEDAA